jgi:hypothetical protein
MYSTLILWYAMISGYRREIDKNSILLGYYAMSSGNSLMMFRENLSVPSSRVKNPKISGTTKMGPIGCLEMSVRDYHYWWCINPEKCSSLLTICHCAVKLAR